MSTLILLSLFILGLAGIILQFKKEHRFVNIFYVLVFTIATIWASDFYSQGSMSALYGLIAVVGINFAVSNITFLKKSYLRTIVPLISLIAYLLYFNGSVIEVQGNSYAFVNKFLVLGAVLAILAFEIARIKSKVLGKLFGGIEDVEMIKSIFIMFIGLTAFLGFFAASGFGVLLIGAFFLSTSFYREDEFGSLSISFIGLMSLPLFAGISNIQDVSLLGGDVIEGLFFGAFSAYFISKIFSSGKSSVIGVVLAYVIAFVLIVGILLLEMMYSSMGGMDAFIGAIVGVTIVNAIIGKGYGIGALLIMLFAIGSYVPQFMVNNELSEFESLVKVDDQNNGEVEVKEEFLALQDLIGDYTIVKDSSVVSFVLGAKGETKGAFKKVSGNIKFNEIPAKSTLKVDLNLNDFTTFNGFRDGSLMEDSYFNQEKYPELTYTGNSFEKVDEFTYKVKGDFKMLGVLKPVEVNLKRVTLNGLDYLVGEGVLDRTLFGMSPSATEGNIVNFNYRVLLKK